MDFKLFFKDFRCDFINPSIFFINGKNLVFYRESPVTVVISIWLERDLLRGSLLSGKAGR